MRNLDELIRKINAREPLSLDGHTAHLAKQAAEALQRRQDWPADIEAWASRLASQAVKSDD